MSYEVDRILAAVSSAFHVPIREILGRSQAQHIMRARHGVYLLCLWYTVHSLRELSKELRRDRSSIRKGYEKGVVLFVSNTSFRTKLDRAIAAVRDELEAAEGGP